MLAGGAVRREAARTRKRGNFGVRKRRRGDGDGLCFWNLVYLQPARENRGLTTSEDLNRVTDPEKAN